MTAKELLNLIDWLRRQGFDDDKIVECLEFVEGRKKILTAGDSEEQPIKFVPFVPEFPS